ncbi:uncharacterized protein LOC143301373 [Babylonia areolata]|uniref:uncharacterized protein LOC143301373 n=1 Tax=Babylonia areolata TaxID=304850 RepID=UPI003FD00FA5
MSVEPNPVVTQPSSSTQSDATTTYTESPITTQPAPAQQSQPPKASDQISYADSDEHARQYYCGLMRCCEACCADGEDKRWYYPWDKGMLRCFPLGCGWCLIGLVFPCCICVPHCRNIICMVQEGAWDGTCFGACICGIPRGSTGRPRSNSEDSD